MRTRQRRDRRMHIPDGYLSPSTCGVLYVGAGAGWYAALKRLKRMLLSRVIPLISRLCGILVCGDDVQPAAARRHDRPRAGRDHRRHRARALGRDSRDLDCACHPGAVLWRRRHQHAGRQLLQHGDRRLAGGLCKLSADRRRRRASPRRRRVVAAAIAGYLAVNAAALDRGRRVRHSAHAVSRCQRNAAVRAVSA